MTPNGVSALAYRARAGLLKAYLAQTRSPGGPVAFPCLIGLQEGASPVGAMWELRVGKTVAFADKNVVPSSLMTIFRESDRYHREELCGGTDVFTDEEHDDAEVHRSIGYRAPLVTVTARLALLGFAVDVVRAEVVEYLSDELADPEDRFHGERWHLRWAREFGDVSTLLEAVVGWVWSTDGHWSAPTVDDKQGFFWSCWTSVVDTFEDPRGILSVLLAHAPSDATVCLDVTDLVVSGYLEEDARLVAMATDDLRREMLAGGKIIVITEGSSDASLIRRALELVVPSLVEYFSFLEFDLNKAQGGTDRVVGLTRGMASADVMNRVVAVLDNDAVGRQAAEQLHRSNLPETFTVFLLHAVDFARVYPTIGPSGSLVEDVNGRACSIEFMFGEQVMRDAFGGNLPPVRWGNHIPGVNEYQGAVEGKKAVQQSIRSALNVPSIEDLPDDTTTTAVRSFVLSFLHAAQFPTNENGAATDGAESAIDQLVMR
jgi:hypothetical protein